MTAESHRAETVSLVIGIVAVLLIASLGLLSAGVAADTIVSGADMTGGAAEPADDAPTYELEIDNDGSAAAIGFPGPVDGTVDDLFVEGTDGVSAVYRYSAADEGWNNVLEEEGVNDFSDVSVDPMDSLVVLTTGQGDSEAIPLEVTLETETGDTVTPGQRAVEAGWNFVSSPQHTDADTVFGSGTANTSLVLERYDGPRTVAVEQTPEFGEYYLDSGHPPTTDPFSGYFVFAQDNGTVPTVASGITDRDDADAQLDLPTFDEVTVRGDITSGAEDGALTDGDLTVRLDGEEIDVTDGEYEETLAPGEYTVTVEADGHQTATRELDARFATTYEEDIELEGAVVNRDGEKSYVSAAAAAEDAGDGATISLESGTYEDDLEITADNVTIEGTSGVSLVSTAAKTGETTVVGDIDIAANGVTIRDLSVHDGTVSAGSSDDLALSGLDIMGETGTADPGVNSAGIEVEGGTNLSITDVAIEADRGISVSGVRTADLRGIDVTTDDGTGLVLYDATGVDLDGVAVEGADQAVGLINLADSTAGNVTIEDSNLGLAVGNESGSQTRPENLTLTGDLELGAIVPYAEMTEDTTDPVDIDRPDGLTYAIRTEPVSGVPVSITGFAYDETSAIAGAVALTDASSGQPLAEASAVQRISDEVYVVAPETSPQDAADIASEGATIEVREGTYDGEMSIQTDGVTVSGENATFEEKFEIDSANDVTLDGLSATNHTIGIEVASSSGVTLRDVNASGNEYEGLLVDSSQNVEIVDATASDNYNGLINVGDGTSVTASNSTFAENEGWGVGTDGDGSLTVRNSTINGNGDGAGIWNDGTLDAAENWWGDSSGPSGEADGTGDSVDSGVDYEPWLDAPPGEGPGGLEDAGVELSNFETDATAANRGDTVTTSVDVTNAVESAGISTMAINDGAEFEVEYVLVDGKDEAQIASETVTVVAGETETVEFTESLPGSTTAHEERSVEHEIRIAGEGVGERADLELSNPVQTALEFAESEGTNTVDVESGTYDETVDLDVDGLTVTGPADGTATITNDSTPVTVSGTGTTVEGLTIESTDLDSAVEIVDPATDVTVADNAIDGGVFVAANDGNLDGVTIERNEIEAVENNGVLASVSGDDTVIDGLEIVDNVFGEYHQNAIRVYSASGGEFIAPVEITGNEIVEEDIFESDGIYVHAAIESVSIENNEIRNAQSSAINVQGAAAEITVRQNTIADNGAGIKLYSSGTLEATENWWGDASGPSGIGDGTGDAIEVDGDGSVEYEPWLDGPIPDGEPVTGDVTGTVIASGEMTTRSTVGSAAPITDADVTIHLYDPDAVGDGNETVAVDDEGTFLAEDIPIGTHGLVVEADGYATDERTVRVDRDQTTTADFDLDYAEGGSIEGTVSLGGEPSESVSVDVIATNGDETFTDAVTIDDQSDSAEYSIDADVDVDDGYAVTAEATGDAADEFATETDDVEVGIGETVTLDLALEPLATQVDYEADPADETVIDDGSDAITYTVTSANALGISVAGIEVEADASAGESVDVNGDGDTATEETDATGAVEFVVTSDTIQDDVGVAFTERQTGNEHGVTGTLEVINEVDELNLALESPVPDATVIEISLEVIGVHGDPVDGESINLQINEGSGRLHLHGMDQGDQTNHYTDGSGDFAPTQNTGDQPQYIGEYGEQVEIEASDEDGEVVETATAVLE
ncbi:hypothetical protein HALLA_00425 (plasmid) [Halostagnicola larsenii XH-48]|uniref:Right handed beta helix domain-containing protein n=1 Tax=Halostagnicola larsenii XH-48 TaxID=797299 RepID=W0JXQ6_9EURY|nr:right-handed parallel beta-helix repeat-containing protein [Halostagnicola larsenii]AHG01788.1 hypothetical protein HALLA_00425 [Halostagnicola larsenii XH-48]